MQKTKRILIVSVNWLGDSILATPVFEALKREFPSSHIGVMAVERVRGVFEDNPYIDEVITFNEKGKQKSLGEKIKFIRFLRKRNFDTVYLIHRSFTRAFICFLAGIKVRVGYARWKNSFVLTKKIHPPAKLMHRQDYYLYLFEKSGIIIENKHTQFFISDRCRTKMNAELTNIRDKHSYVVGMNPSANWGPKRWPSDYFARLADLLMEGLGAAIIFIGAPKEHGVVEEVIKNMKNKAYNFCGKTTLKELGALIENTDIFISNDSGPAHLAAALGVNTFVIFGPTSADRTSPRGKAVKIVQKTLDCELPCYNLDCKDNTCMKDISVEEVFLEAKNILDLQS